jgi:predicted Ser/Thr protein kinase
LAKKLVENTIATKNHVILGSGSFGNVYKGTFKGRLVAVKQAMHMEGGEDLQKFWLEASRNDTKTNELIGLD